MTTFCGARRARTGFTLIELLVVIAIIAILAAILFPVFAKAREKARQITCLSNENQLGLAFMQYNQDNDEFFPIPPNTNPANGPLVPSWAGAVYPYVKSTGVYACPDDSSTTSNPALKRCSYAFNSNFLYDFGAFKPVKLAQMNAPASTVILVEVDGGGMVPGNGDYSPVGDGWNQANSAAGYRTGLMGNRAFQTNVPAGENITPRHTNGSNFLAADGHATYLVGSRVSNGPTCYPYPDGGTNSAQGKDNYACAAGTNIMTDMAGDTFTLTFSVD